MDINTIFYFAGSQEEYDNNKLLINSRTISFVPNNDGKTGSIYKAGIKYSGDITDAINTLVKWDGKYHTGTNIGDLIVNGERTPVWVPTSSGGGSGSGSGGGIDVDQQEAIDRLNDTIQRLRDSLEEIKNTADSESERLDNLYINIENSIRNKFGDMLNDANFLESLGDGWYSNFGKDLTDSEIEYYLQMIGAIEEKNGEKIYTWTKIQQEIDKLTLTTNALIRNGNLDENTVEGLYAQLQLTIQDEIARQNLAVGWGQYAEDTKDVLLWMNSQLDQGASKEETWNELVSAAKNNSGEAGIADLYTRVRNLETGLLSEAGFNAKVDNAISGIKASTTGEYTSTQIFSRIKLNEDNIAALYTKATGQQVEAGAGVDFAGWTGGFITTANAAEALAALVSASADNAFKAGILSLVGVDENGDRYSTFQLIAENDPNAAATIVGLVNGSGSSIQIDADKINLHGDTWAQTLHVDELITDVIKDSDGNSVQTSYLIDKASEKPYCYVVYNNAFTDLSSFNDMHINYINAPQMVKAGDHLLVDFIYSEKYDIRNSLKVTVGSEDVTSRYCNHDVFAFGGHKVVIEIPSVTGDVEITIKNPIYTGESRLVSPRMIKNGSTSVQGQLICTDESLLPEPIYNNGEEYWNTSSTNIEITAAAGYSSTPTVSATENALLGVTDTVSYVDESGTQHSYLIHVASSSSLNYPYIHSFLMHDFEIHIGDVGNNAFTYNINDAIEWKDGTGTVSSAVFSIPSDYSNIATCNSNGKITPVSVGLFKLECTITYDGFSMSDYCWGWVKSNTFSDVNTHEYCNVDLFGNSSDNNQIVYLPQFKMYDRTLQEGGYKYTTTATVLLPGTVTKNISYNRSGSNAIVDKHLIYLCNWSLLETDSSLKPKGYSILKPDWITNCSLSELDSESGGFAYLSFNVSPYTEAILHYRSVGLLANITKDDQYENNRYGQIKVTAPDGSYIVVNVIQSGRYGFYGDLKDKVRGIVSAYCLTPSYGWSLLKWYGSNSEQFVRTNLYPDAIMAPQNGYACIAVSSMNAMPNSTMGIMKSEFGENPKLVIEK